MSSSLTEPLIDNDVLQPQGEACIACGAPLDPDDRFCTACGNTVAQHNETPQAVTKKHFRCENCGSEVATDPDHRSYTCPFCDSTYVVEFSPEQSDRQPPEFVIGFRVTLEQAQEKFRTWLNENSWFRPGDLQTAQIAEKLRGIYTPFWTFSMLVQSGWSASVGEYWYRTETYTTMENGKTVTKTRTVRETEWWDLGGQHHKYYSGYLVSGSNGLPQNQADRIKPFQLPALKRYEPYFLAGWLSEEYSVQKDEALEYCKQEFYRREQNEVGDFLPGDTHRDVQVKSNFSDINSDLILLPIYLLSYRYGDRLFQFMINGQTGKVAGDKPVSGKRIAVAVVGGIALLALVVMLVMLLGQ
ncbi:MAG: zinc ribbon domain-containing protein [Planctomycetales bacterium]